MAKLADGTPLNVGVYNAYRNAGLSHNQALAITAEVGRENGFIANTLFGYHEDPAPDESGKKLVNIGMLSWNRNRGANVKKYLEQRGVMRNGQMEKSQANLNAQAAFSVAEMKSPTWRGRLNSFWSNPNANPDTFARELGKNYIVWAYGQNSIRAKGGGRKPFDWQTHDSRRRNYMQQTAKALGDKTSYQTTQRSSQSAPIYFGDSIAHGYKFVGNPKATDYSTTKGGESPFLVYKRMANYVKNNPGALKGKVVVLSSGKSNMPTGQDEYIVKQIELLKSQGAIVNLMGIAENYSNPKYYPKANGKAMISDLERIAQQTGVNYTGNFHGDDGIHPFNDYKKPSFLGQVMQGVPQVQPLSNQSAAVQQEAPIQEAPIQEAPIQEAPQQNLPPVIPDYAKLDESKYRLDRTQDDGGLPSANPVIPEYAKIGDNQYNTNSIASDSSLSTITTPQEAPQIENPLQDSMTAYDDISTSDIAEPIMMDSKVNIKKQDWNDIADRVFGTQTDTEVDAFDFNKPITRAIGGLIKGIV